MPRLARYLLEVLNRTFWCGMVVFLIPLVLSGCGPKVADPRNLHGTFRSRVPIANSANTPSFRKFEFSSDGQVIQSLVDRHGAVVSGQSRRVFTVHDDKITVEPVSPNDPRILYLPTTMTYLDERTLRLDGTGEILIRQ